MTALAVDAPHRLCQILGRVLNPPYRSPRQFPIHAVATGRVAAVHRPVPISADCERPEGESAS